MAPPAGAGPRLGRMGDVKSKRGKQRPPLFPRLQCGKGLSEGSQLTPWLGGLEGVRVADPEMQDQRPPPRPPAVGPGQVPGLRASCLQLQSVPRRVPWGLEASAFIQGAWPDDGVQEMAVFSGVSSTTLPQMLRPPQNSSLPSGSWSRAAEAFSLHVTL